MSETSNKIPFSIEIGRVIDVLALQIYPSPLALLRENVQNSYDAILQRKHLGQEFNPLINVIIEPNRISVTDNGLGMSTDDLKNHFWRAGSSSKNTPEAKAAGVVGTFGIGAMANFGIAEELTVETESIKTSERTICSASRATLSVTQDCISFKNISPTGSPGTTITAKIQADKTINIQQAVTYISQFISYLQIDVIINGVKMSGQEIENSVPNLINTWSVQKNGVDLGDGFKANIDLSGAITGDIRIVVSNIEYGSQKINGKMVLRQGTGVLKTFRSGFGLATTNVSSKYQFGGVADFLFLYPTAGREALTTDSTSLLQKIVTCIDEFVSLELANRPESNANSYFVSWAASKHRYDLCSFLRVRIEPGDSLTLLEVKERSEHSKILVYPGADPATVKHASEDRPIIMLTRGSPRRECELNYLRKYCIIEELSDNQRVLNPVLESEMTIPQRALAFRLAYILTTDYFLDTSIKFGTISHGLPVLVTNKNKPVEIFLDPAGATVQLILNLYTTEYSAFDHMSKDFVRNMIFSRISDLVPSSTRQGAEAFLKSISRTRELFEYGSLDQESLSNVWQEFDSGKISFQEATQRSNIIALRGYQILDFSAAATVKDVVPDVISNEALTGGTQDIQFVSQPSIQRLDVTTPKKLLTISDDDEPLKGYRCFLALTDRIKEERGDFFLQPHRTSVVWGGQKALFIFEHHSGNYGLYYDLQTQNLISDQSGGGSFETCTIVMKNRIFIPIPQDIQKCFLPQQNETKKFEVKCDILYIDRKFHL